MRIPLLFLFLFSQLASAQTAPAPASPGGPASRPPAATNPSSAGEIYLTNNPYSVFQYGADVRVISYQFKNIVTPAGAPREQGVIYGKVVEQIHGEKKDEVAIPYHREGRGGSRVNLNWARAATFERDTLLLVITAPWYQDRNESAIPDIKGSAFHVYILKTPDDPIVLSWRRLARLAALKGDAYAKALDEALIDPDPLLRHFARTAATRDFSPPQSATLLIKQWTNADRLSIPQPEAQDLANTMTRSLWIEGSTDQQRSQIAAALAESLTSKNALIRRQAIVALSSIASASRLSTPNITPLAFFSPESLAQTITNAQPLLNSETEPRTFTALQNFLSWALSKTNSNTP